MHRGGDKRPRRRTDRLPRAGTGHRHIIHKREPRRAGKADGVHALHALAHRSRPPTSILPSCCFGALHSSPSPAPNAPRKRGDTLVVSHMCMAGKLRIDV
eukprot:scaffold12417_cov131-Isochrysis_galbana.AAC.15